MARLGGSPTTASDQIRSFSPSTLPPPQIPPCITVPQPGQPERVSFHFWANPTVAGDYSFTDAGISDEQFNVAQGFISSLTQFRRPGDMLRSAIITHKMNFPGILPKDGIPYDPGANVLANPRTGRRADNYRAGFRYRPMSGQGNTIFENYDSQTRRIRDILRQQLGPSIQGNTIWGPSNGRRYQFRGVLLRPTFTTKTICF